MTLSDGETKEFQISQKAFRQLLASSTAWPRRTSVTT
jgi:hypothetical protein